MGWGITVISESLRAQNSQFHGTLAKNDWSDFEISSSFPCVHFKKKNRGWSFSFSFENYTWLYIGTIYVIMSVFFPDIRIFFPLENSSVLLLIMKSQPTSFKLLVFCSRHRGGWQALEQHPSRIRTYFNSFHHKNWPKLKNRYLGWVKIMLNLFLFLPQNFYFLKKIVDIFFNIFFLIIPLYADL